MEQVDKNFVDTSRLPIRVMIKGYKQMCEILNEKNLGTSAKGRKHQKKNWERFFTWVEITPYKYYVTEIYNDPLPLIDQRVNNGGVRNIVEYIPLYKDMIMDYVCNRHYEYDKPNEITVSPYILYESMGILHRNFNRGRNNYQKVAYHEKLNVMNTKISFDYIHGQIKGHTDKALRELENEGSIILDMPYWITLYGDEVERTVKKDQYGAEYPIFKLDGRIVQGIKQPATDEQERQIKECQQAAKDYFNVTSGFIPRELKRKVDNYASEILFNKYKIGFYWQKYHIRVIKMIESKMTDISVSTFINHLHTDIKDRLLSNFTNRQNTRNKRVKENCEAELENIPKSDWGGANPFVQNEIKEKHSRRIEYNLQQLEAFKHIVSSFVSLDAEIKGYLID